MLLQLVVLSILVINARAQQVYTVTQYPSTCSAIYTSGTQSVVIIQSTTTTTATPTPFSDQAANNGMPFVLQLQQPGTYGKRQSSNAFYIMPNGNTTNDGTLAAQYYIKSGQLSLWSGGYYSTSPGVQYQPFAANSTLGSINTTFMIYSGKLTWSNPQIYSDGSALFYKTPAAAVVNAQVIVAFTNQDQSTPTTWSPLNLVARAVSAAQPPTYPVVTSNMLPGMSTNAMYSMPVFTYAPVSSSTSSPAMPVYGNTSPATSAVPPPISMSGIVPYGSSTSSSGLPSSLMSLSTITAPGTPIGPIRPSQLYTNSISSSTSIQDQAPMYSMDMGSSSMTTSSSVIAATSTSIALAGYGSILQSSSSPAMVSTSTSTTSSMTSSSSSASSMLILYPPQATSSSFAMTSTMISTMTSTTTSTVMLTTTSTITSTTASTVSSTIIKSSSIMIISSSSLLSSSFAASSSVTTSTSSLSSPPSGVYVNSMSSLAQVSLTSTSTSTAPKGTGTWVASTYACPAVNGSIVNDNWGTAFIIGCGLDTTYGSYDAESVSNSWNECFWKCHNSSTVQGVGKCTAFTYLGGTNGTGAGTCFLKDLGAVAFTGSGSGLVAAIQYAYYAGTTASSTGSAVVSPTSRPLSTSSNILLSSTTSTTSSVFVQYPTTSSVMVTTSSTIAQYPGASTASSSASSASSSAILSSSSTTVSTTSTPSLSSAYLILPSPTPCNFGDPAGTDQDDSYCEIDLPFSMSMYSVSAPQTFASTNGYISMINGSSQYQVNPLPFSGIPATTILPLFDDLYIYGSASPAQGIFYQANSTGVTYEYYLGRANASTAINHFTVSYATASPGIFRYTYYNIGNGFNGNTSCVGSQGQNSGGNEIASQFSYQSAAIFPGSVIICNTNANVNSCTRSQ